MIELPENLKTKLSLRENDGSLRALKNWNTFIDFSSNDYLGYAQKQISNHTTLAGFKKGATGSRLLTGHHEIHEKFEEQLSKHFSMPSALLFNSGYDANLGFFSAVPQRTDIVFYDEYCHASIRDGIRLGLAKSIKYPHQDLNTLAHLMTKWRKNNQGGTGIVYIATESIFSMDGDATDLERLATLSTEHEAHLIVDEAHALGTYKLGMVGDLGIQDQVFAQIITFGKSIGLHGAAIMGSQNLKKYLLNFARSLIYSTAISPFTVEDLSRHFDHYFSLKGEEDRTLLKERIQLFKKSIESSRWHQKYLKSNSPIQGVILENNQTALSLADILGKNGYAVAPILSPTVPRGTERLRICLHTFNTEKEIKNLIETIDGCQLD